MPTKTEEQLMKHLRISDGTAQFSTDDDEWTDIEKISKDDILKLVDLALNSDFELDAYEKEKILNPAQDIIYRNIVEKMGDLISKRDRFKDESNQFYAEAIQKYRIS